MTVVIGLKGLAFCTRLAKTVCNGFPCGILYQVWYLIVSFPDLSWSLMSFLNTCHTRRRFHCIATKRTQENHDIFREKLSVMASLQWPRRCHGALIAFYRIPTVFMVEILCNLTVLLLCIHGAHSACAALSRRCHCHTCHTRRRFHCVVTVRTQENHDIFREKLSERRPYSDQGVATELSLGSIVFLRCSWWRFSAISRCFHCASTALTGHAPRFHGFATALRTQWHLQECVQSPCKCHGWPQHLHNDPCVRPRSSYCVVGDLSSGLWWPYGVPSALY